MSTVRSFLVLVENEIFVTSNRACYINVISQIELSAICAVLVSSICATLYQDPPLIADSRRSGAGDGECQDQLCAVCGNKK